MWGCVDEKEEKKKKKKKKKKEVASEGRTTSVARLGKSSLLTALKLTLAFKMGEGRVDWDPDLRKLLFVQSHHTFP